MAEKAIKEISIVEDGITHVGRATKEQLDQWKKDQKAKDLSEGIHEITVSVRENGKEISYGYVAEPERLHVAKVMSLLGGKEVLPAGEYIINNLWLGGDPRMKSEKWINFNAAMAAAAIVEFRDTSVKKL